jgi:hypothetical protein
MLQTLHSAYLLTEYAAVPNASCCCCQVCECVVILKNLKDVSWAGAKSMMTDPGFLKSLVEFDKDGLTEKQVKRVKTEYMKDPSFTYDNIRNISTAGAGEMTQNAVCANDALAAMYSTSRASASKIVCLCVACEYTSMGLHQKRKMLVCWLCLCAHCCRSAQVGACNGQLLQCRQGS